MVILHLNNSLTIKKLKFMKKQIFKRKDIIMMGDYDDFEQSSCPSYLMGKCKLCLFCRKN